MKRCLLIGLLALGVAGCLRSDDVNIVGAPLWAPPQFAGEWRTYLADDLMRADWDTSLVDTEALYTVSRPEGLGAFPFQRLTIDLMGETQRDYGRFFMASLEKGIAVIGEQIEDDVQFGVLARGKDFEPAFPYREGFVIFRPVPGNSDTSRDGMWQLALKYGLVAPSEERSRVFLDEETVRFPGKIRLADLMPFLYDALEGDHISLRAEYVLLRDGATPEDP